MAASTTRTITVIAFRLVLVALALLLPVQSHPTRVSASFSSITASQVSLPRIPLSFIPNFGQTDPTVAFQARSPGGSLFFTANQVHIVLPSVKMQERLPVDLALRQSPDLSPETPTMVENKPALLRLSFIGANPTPEMTGVNQLPGIANYFYGNDPAKWHSNIPTYAGIVYHDLYPGIDLLYEGRDGEVGLKGTYTIDAGVDASQIRWRYDAAAVEADRQGNLHISYAGGSSGEHSVTGKMAMIELAPIAWQGSGQLSVAVAVQYRITPDGSVTFSFPQGYDRSQTLVIDPTLVYSSYVGDILEDNGSGIVVDSTGIYVAGLTQSTGFPVAGPPYQGSNVGGYDAYVTKLNPAGSALIYSTYLGGSGSDYGLGLAVDTDRTVYITGLTDLTDFPVSASAFDQTCGGVSLCISGVYDAYVTRLNATGSGLLYSTYLGGDALDIGYSIAANNSGETYVAGRTESSDFPIAGTPYQASSGGLADGFVVKVDTGVSGVTSLEYSTYLGGDGADRFIGIVLDSSGNAYMTGRTTSSNYPLSGNPFQNSLAGGIDAVVTKLNSTGSALLYSTYFGGSSDEAGFIIDLDPSNQVYISGQTISTDFPVSTGAYDTTCGTDGTCNGGQWDAFAVKIDPAASGAASRVYATYFGGSQVDSGQSIAVDGSGNAYLTGYTDSPDLPVANAFQPTCSWGCGSGYVDAFVAGFNASGSGLIYSTFLGGSSSDYGIAIILDSSGAAYITGDAYSGDFPTVNPYDSTHAGGYDVFISKIDGSSDSSNLSVTTTGATVPVQVNLPLTYTLTVANAGASAATGVRLVDTLPVGVGFNSATVSQGSCQLVAITAVSCSLGNLALGVPLTVTISITPYSTGTITNRADVMSNLADPDKADNSASVSNPVYESLNYLPQINK